MSGFSIDRVAGQPVVTLAGPGGARARLALFGGQLLSWQPADGRERLYLSPAAALDGQRALRGGIPVCFPQFGAQGPLPRHGLLRTRPWQLVAQQAHPDYATLLLATESDPATLAQWPHPFRAELSVALDADRLDLELEIFNTGPTPFAFRAALHTYLAVDEVEHCSLAGLYGHAYRDSRHPDAPAVRDSATELVVDDELDRCYLAVRRPLRLATPGHTLDIVHSGFEDVVVWNPWLAGNAIDDLPAKGFRRFLCIEAAQIANPVQLAPGKSWWGRQSLMDADDAAAG